MFDFSWAWTGLENGSSCHLHSSYQLVGGRHALVKYGLLIFMTSSS